MSFHRPQYSARMHGALRTLEDRRDAAYNAALEAEDERECAMLRGKAKAYNEGVELLRAIEHGWNLPRRFRWSRRR